VCVGETTLAPLCSLGNIFNGLDVKNPRRMDVYKIMLRCAVAGGQSEAVLGTIAQLDGWLEEWGATPEQQREVLELACDTARAAGNDTMLLHTLLPRFLATFSSAQRDATSDAAATRAITLAVGLPGVYRMDHLLALEAVRALRDAPAPGPAVLQLLEVFVSGDIAQFNAWRAANPQLFAQLGLDEAASEHKIRLLTLLSLCAARGGGDVSFEEAAVALQLPTDAAEQWFVDATAAGLTNAHIDQQARKAAVTACFQRVFGREQWAQLETRLVAWRTNILALRGVLQQVAAAKATQQQQQSRPRQTRRTVPHFRSQHQPQSQP